MLHDQRVVGPGQKHAGTRRSACLPLVPGVLHPRVPGTPHPRVPGVHHLRVPGVHHLRVPGVHHLRVPGVHHLRVPGTPHPRVPGVPHPLVPGVSHPLVPGVLLAGTDRSVIAIRYKFADLRRTGGSDGIVEVWIPMPSPRSAG
ncbi:hypothetical protein HPY32_25480 [Nocardia terpenica]|nr:hypothetical protein [Nocardia terpenica]